MTLPVKKIEATIRASRVAVNNALAHNEIKERVLEFGYDEARLQEGLELCNRTDQKYQEQQQKKGEQIRAGEILHARLKQVRKRYVDYRQLARKNFTGEGNEGIRQTLGVAGIARRSLDGVLKEGRQFYEVLLADEDILAKMAKFALTAEKLQGCLAELDELKKLNEDQESKKGQAQQATKERDDLYRELRQWLGEFTLSCRSAFIDDRQHLEKLGMVAYSEGYRRKGGKSQEEAAPEGEAGGGGEETQEAVPAPAQGKEAAAEQATR